METLYSRNIYATATVRTNRKGLPLLAKNKKMKKGLFKWRVKDHVGFVQWQDTKLVNVLSTAYFPNVDLDVMRTQKDGSWMSIKCPQPVAQYTRRMGGVDRFDQKRSFYEVGRKSKRWWLRIFYFLLDSAIVNAFILRNIFHKQAPVKIIDLKRMLAQELCGTFCSRKRPSSHFSNFSKKSKANAPTKELGVPLAIRLGDVGVHLPADLESFRRCRYCSTKTNNKRSKIQCSRCQVPLCVTPCFSLFHQ